MIVATTLPVASFLVVWTFATTAAILVFLHARSEEHTSELQSQFHLVCRLLLEKKKKLINRHQIFNHHRSLHSHTLFAHKDFSDKTDHLLSIRLALTNVIHRVYLELHYTLYYPR